MLIYSGSKPDSKLLQDVFRKIVGFSLTDGWNIRQICSRREMEALAKIDSKPSICCVDITMAEGVAAAEYTRSCFASVMLVLVVNGTMSPMSYIRPTTMPAGILIKPLEADQAGKLFSDLLPAVQQRKRQDVFEGKVFLVNSHGSSYRVPLADILYFEARNKKLYLYTQRTEIEFYDTLDHLLEQLPEQFCRCHKSFVVNRMAVEQVLLAKNLIVMGGGEIQIPISRSWKSAVREALA